jgi:pyrroline-5-carboxylate reductase
MEMINPRIGFLGAGQMATALALGIVQSEVVAPQAIAAADPDEDARSRFADAVAGASLATDNREVVRRSDVLVLAVKPHLAIPVLEEVRKETPAKLIISIAAGVRLAQLEAAAPPTARLVRVMPRGPPRMH